MIVLGGDVPDPNTLITVLPGKRTTLGYTPDSKYPDTRVGVNVNPYKYPDVNDVTTFPLRKTVVTGADTDVPLYKVGRLDDV
jgi:hypothetical protein